MYGSPTLMRTLAEHDLLDEYQFWVHPLVLGSGKRLLWRRVRADLPEARRLRAAEHRRRHPDLSADVTEERSALDDELVAPGGNGVKLVRP